MCYESVRIANDLVGSASKSATNTAKISPLLFVCVSDPGTLIRLDEFASQNTPRTLP
jgi:hypothetical protein